MKNETSTRALVCRILMLLYIFAVAFLCFKNFKKLPDVPRMLFGIPIDKVVHFCMFVPFPVLGYYSFDHERWSVGKTFGKIIEVFSYGVIFAGVTELVQSMLPYRTQDIKDFKADVIAVGLATIFVFILELLIRKRRRK